METYVVRMWLPDRPGALGQVASRIGAVRGEIVGIDILERGAGRAIDELVVDLPDGSLQELLVQEIQQVDGVDVEEVRPVADALHDPRLDALETAAILVGATDRDELVQARRRARPPGGRGGVVGGRAARRRRRARRRRAPCPPAPWLVAFVEGSQSSARVASGEAGPDDVVWSPLPVGRPGPGRRAQRHRLPSAGAPAGRRAGPDRRHPPAGDHPVFVLPATTRPSPAEEHPDALRHPHRRQPPAHPEARSDAWAGSRWPPGASRPAACRHHGPPPGTR